MSNMSEGREQNLFDLYDQNSGLVHQFEARSEFIFVKHNGGWVDFVCDVGNVRADQEERQCVPRKIQHVTELGNLAEANRFALFLRFTMNSNSRISPSRPLFEDIMSMFEVSSRFREFVMCFGFKKKEYDYTPPSCKVRNIHEQPRGQDRIVPAALQVKAQGSSFECTYGFRYAVDTGNKEIERNRWSVRQTALYQKYDSTSDKVVWICIGASKKTEKYITEHTISSDGLGIADPFLIHACIIETSLASWKPYIQYLSESIQDITDEKALVDVEENSFERPTKFRLDFRFRQKLKILQDKIVNTRTILQSTIETLKCLQRHHMNRKEQFGSTSGSKSDDEITTMFEEQLRHAYTDLAKFESLNEKIRSTTSLLSDLLSYDHAFSLEQLVQEQKDDSKKATEDSRSIKLITIITAVFFPATVTAGFFSTQFVQVSSGHFQLSHCTWVYFAVTIPLTVLTIAAWAVLPKVYMWMCHRTSPGQQEDSQPACDVEERQPGGNRVSIRRILGKFGGGLPLQVDNSSETLSKIV